MDKKKSLLNVGVSVAFKLILLVGFLIVRRILIQCVGNEVNGLDSLYVSIVGFLTVAELGVGTAITFSMYRPIVEGKTGEVAALYQLFQKSYRIIGGVIFVAGAALLPVLPYLAKDYASLPVDLHGTFFLMLVSVVLSYMFSAKISLINAYKNDYISTTITSGGMLVQYGLQILVLLMTRSFTWYLVCRIGAVLVQWVAAEICARAMHRDIIRHSKSALAPEAKKNIVRNVKAMFMHRIGGILVNSADSIIISAFIGVAVLGRYSNYATIAASMSSVIALVFSQLTSVIGHMYVTEREQSKRYYRFFFGLNYMIGVVFFLGYYAVIDDLIALIFGAGLTVSRSVSMVITVNYFIQFMRQSTLLFKDATGAFYYDRWKPFFEGLSNVVLSILFVMLFTQWWSPDYGVVGVILATIITNLTICHIVEPYVLYKHVFASRTGNHWLKLYAAIGGFVAALFVMDRCMYHTQNLWLELLVNGCISVAISGVLVGIWMGLDKNFRQHCAMALKKTKE